MKRTTFLLMALMMVLIVAAQAPFKVKSQLVTNLYKEKGVRKAKVTLTLEADKKLSKVEIRDSLNTIVKTAEIDRKKKAEVDVSGYADGTHRVVVYTDEGANQMFMIKKIIHSK